MNWEVHRTCLYGGSVYVTTLRWRWLARLFAWEHTARGWFRYFVVAADAPESTANYRKWVAERPWNSNHRGKSAKTATLCYFDGDGDRAS